MSYLRIVSQYGQIVNPEFLHTFSTMLEENTSAAIDITKLRPFLNSDTDEKLRECDDVQAMAVFMLLCHTLIGVKWGEKFYFGDVDLMDNEFNFNEEDATVLQYCIEDPPITFAEFQASGKDVEDIGQYNEEWYDAPGRVYLASPDETSGLVIANTTTWEQLTEKKWYLRIGNIEWFSDSLLDLEKELYKFAESAGWLTKPETT